MGRFTLAAWKGKDGRLVWTADGKREFPTAEKALGAAGAQLDLAVAQLPGQGWLDVPGVPRGS